MIWALRQALELWMWKGNQSCRLEAYRVEGRPINKMKQNKKTNYKTIKVLLELGLKQAKKPYGQLGEVKIFRGLAFVMRLQE